MVNIFICKKNILIKYMTALASVILENGSNKGKKDVRIPKRRHGSFSLIREVGLFPRRGAERS